MDEDGVDKEVEQTGLGRTKGWSIRRLEKTRPKGDINEEDKGGRRAERD
jgi:hypothetical protein